MEQSPCTSRYDQIRQHVDALIALCTSDDFYKKYINCPSYIKDIVVCHAIKLFDRNYALEHALRKHNFVDIRCILDGALQQNESGLPDILVFEMRREFDNIFNEKEGDELETIRKTCLRLCILINKT